MIPPADWALQRAFVKTSILAAWPDTDEIYWGPLTSVPNFTRKIAVAIPGVSSPESDSMIDELVSVSWSLMRLERAPATTEDALDASVADLDALATQLLVDTVPGGGMLPRIPRCTLASRPEEMDGIFVSGLTFQYDYSRARS